jgi:hypothetical protein
MLCAPQLSPEQRKALTSIGNVESIATISKV